MLNEPVVNIERLFVVGYASGVERFLRKLIGCLLYGEVVAGSFDGNGEGCACCVDRGGTDIHNVKAQLIGTGSYKGILEGVVGGVAFICPVGIVGVGAVEVHVNVILQVLVSTRSTRSVHGEGRRCAHARGCVGAGELQRLSF